MHKVKENGLNGWIYDCYQGYAFVQFTSPFDARSACLGEDGKSLCGQVLDVNMVSEPKAHVTKGKAIKRQTEKGEVDQQVMANQPLLAYYMISLVGGAGLQNPLPAAKRPRVEDANGDTNDSET